MVDEFWEHLWRVPGSALMTLIVLFGYLSMERSLAAKTYRPALGVLWCRSGLRGVASLYVRAVRRRFRRRWIGTLLGRVGFARFVLYDCVDGAAVGVLVAGLVLYPSGLLDSWGPSWWWVLLLAVPVAVLIGPVRLRSLLRFVGHRRLARLRTRFGYRDAAPGLDDPRLYACQDSTLDWWLWSWRTMASLRNGMQMLGLLALLDPALRFIELSEEDSKLPNTVIYGFMAVYLFVFLLPLVLVPVRRRLLVTTGALATIEDYLNGRQPRWNILGDRPTPAQAHRRRLDAVITALKPVIRRLDSQEEYRSPRAHLLRHCRRRLIEFQSNVSSEAAVAPLRIERLVRDAHVIIWGSLEPAEYRRIGRRWGCFDEQGDPIVEPGDDTRPGRFTRFFERTVLRAEQAKGLAVALGVLLGLGIVLFLVLAGQLSVAELPGKLP